MAFLDETGLAELWSITKAKAMPTKETAALFGLGEGATVDDVLRKIPKLVSRVGDIRTTLRSDLGDDWLLCNGEALDTARYPELAKLIIPTKGAATAGASGMRGNTGFSQGYYATCKYVNGRLFVCTGTSGSSPLLYVSDNDGATFTTIETGASTNFSDIIYYDGMYIAVGSGYSPNTITVAYSSDDLATWTHYTVAAGQGQREYARIAVHDGIFVVTGFSGVFVSTDITSDNFVLRELTADGLVLSSIRSIFYDEHRKLWFTGGFANKSNAGYPLYMLYATDPRGEWTSRLISTQNSYYTKIDSIVCTKHYIVLAGQKSGSNKVWRMTDVDATIFESQPHTSGESTANGIGVCGGLFYVTVVADSQVSGTSYINRGMLTSSDAYTWTNAWTTSGSSATMDGDKCVILQPTSVSEWKVTKYGLDRYLPTSTVNNVYTYIKAKEDAP